MSEKKDQLKEILKDQLNKEAKQIEEEVGLNDNEEIPNELKIRMKNALDQKIREREKRSEDMKRTDAYAKLSEEDQEALRIGREMMKNQSEEKKIYTMRRKKRNIRRVSCSTGSSADPRNGSWNDKHWRTRENAAVYEEFCRWQRSFSSRFQR